MDELQETLAGKRVATLIEAANKARQRRIASPRLEGAFLALAGIATDEEVLHFDEGFQLRQLQACPLVWGCELTRSSAITHELYAAVPRTKVFERVTLDGVFWTLQSLLHVRKPGYFVATEVATESWEIIDGFDPSEGVRTWPIPTRVPSWWPHAPLIVDASDCVWVSSVWMRALELRADPKFHFALESFATSFVEADIRMACTKLWAGVEAVIGVNAELRFRLAALVAALLEPAGGTRVALYRQVTKLYDTRSKIVHGGSVGNQQLVTHVSVVQDLMRRILARLLEMEKMPDTRALEANLLGESLS